MSEGTTPLTIHVPLRAPISSKMSMALVTLEMLCVIAFSKSFHGMRKKQVPISTQIADTASSVTWLAPDSERCHRCVQWLPASVQVQ